MPPISVNNAASAFGKSHTLNFFCNFRETQLVSSSFNPGFGPRILPSYPRSLCECHNLVKWAFIGL